MARHYIKTSGVAGAINVRKYPGNSRVTLVEMFDARGAYIDRSFERKVETAFYREDFKRIDPDDLGQIEFVSRAVEEYQTDYLSLLGAPADGRRLRVVCDYGFSSFSSIFPSLLAKMEIESIALNGYNDAKLAPRTRDQIASHVTNLSRMVQTLGYDLGLLFTQEGERLTLVDNTGREIVGHTLLATIGTLVAKTQPGARIAISITAPTLLEEALVKAGAQVLRTKSDVRSLMSASIAGDVTFAGDEAGGFIFPALHPGFDAAFSFGMLASMLRRTGLRVSEVASELPSFFMAYDQVRVPWESKGEVMRRITEESRHMDRVEQLDGIKIYDHDSWVLVLPDSLEPVLHVYAESADESGSKALVSDYAHKIEGMLAH